jgi:hypothetical protein
LKFDPASVFSNAVAKPFKMDKGVFSYSEGNQLMTKLPITETMDQDLSPSNNEEMGRSQKTVVPLNITNSFDKDRSRLGVPDKNRANNFSMNFDSKNKDMSTENFILQTMSSLEYLKSKMCDVSNVSNKGNNDTVKSIDFVSSPELGKTKDTSALSGTKMMNTLSNNKSNISLPNNSSLIANSNPFQKLINSSEMSQRNKDSGRLMTHPIKNLGDLTGKSKYLNTDVPPFDSSSFAAKCKAVHLGQAHGSKVSKGILKSSSKTGKKKSKLTPSTLLK